MLRVSTVFQCHSKARCFCCLPSLWVWGSHTLHRDRNLGIQVHSYARVEFFISYFLLLTYRGLHLSLCSCSFTAAFLIIRCLNQNNIPFISTQGDLSTNLHNSFPNVNTFINAPNFTVPITIYSSLSLSSLSLAFIARNNWYTNWNIPNLIRNLIKFGPCEPECNPFGKSVVIPSFSQNKGHDEVFRMWYCTGVKLLWVHIRKNIT